MIEKESYNYNIIKEKFSENNFEKKIFEKNKELDDFWSMPKIDKSLPKKESINPLPSLQQFDIQIFPEIKTPQIPLSAVFPVPDVQHLPPLPDIKPLPKPAHYTPPKGVISEFMTDDPFVDDVNRLTKKQAKKAHALARVAAGGVEETGIAALQLSKDEKQAATTIGVIFDSFVKDNYPGMAAQKDWPQLRERMQVILMKFAVSHFSSHPFDLSTLNTPALMSWTRSAVEVGLRAFDGAQKLDNSLYEKLFEEMDSLKSGGRNPLEVYLGRDGIYAYEARRAQDVSQRRKMSWQERKALKEKGIKPGLNIEYLVYPRLFRDTLSAGIKREYLHSKGIVADADPVFYDTGFVGSIPEQILRMLGYDGSEIDDRMKLLSAPVEKRRVKGIDESQRSNIVHKIEYNAKPEEMAIGLYKNAQTGEIRPVAKPASPEEQYMFEMIKLAIRSHFYEK